MFQSHILRPMTSAHLAQTMTLLSLTADELRQEIDSELASNPALELVEERRCPTCHRPLPGKGACPICSQPKSDTDTEPIVFVSPREDFYNGSSAHTSSDDSHEDDYSADIEDLPTFVLRQIAPELAQEDRGLAAYLLTHLDEEGFLTTTAVEVARYFHILPQRVENIIRQIQRCEPVGVGSSCPQEALLVQLEVLAESRPIPALARPAVQQGMDLLSRRQYTDLAHLLKANLRQVQEVARFISDNLNPFPARSFWGDQRTPSAPSADVYHSPDIIVSYLNEDPDNQLVVEIIMPLFGTLRVNPLFRQALREAEENKLGDWKADLERASLLVKCIQQRNHTMRRLLARIVAVQKDFILHGEKQMKSLTRASLAKELELHESTISRAVSNKAVQLPNGRIVPLSVFFDRSLNIRTVLRTIIEQEHKPLSDTDLVDLLAHQGYHVARRTVAKYRAMEGILPAHLRLPLRQSNVSIAA